MATNMLLSPEALHCLKRKQLTNLCRRFGIKAVGKNADLIQRLQEYAASNIPSDSPTKGNVAVLRHIKRPRQSDASSDSDSDNQYDEQKPTTVYPPLTPRTRQKRVSDIVQAIEEVKAQPDEMDSDDELDDPEVKSPSCKNTIAFPVKQQQAPLSPQSTQPLRIIKALPSSTRLASPLSTATILELSRPPAAHEASNSATASMYPDISTLPLPEGISSDCLASSSTLPSITSRQFSAAAASVLAEMNARLTAAGRSTTSASLATMSSMGNGAWQTLASSTSTQGMSQSRSGRYEIQHERQFKKMDSIVNHYAARRVGTADKSDASASTSSRSETSSSVVAATKSLAVARKPQRVDASTSTRSLAAMVHSTSTRKVASQRRPLPVPPALKACSKPPAAATTRVANLPSSRQASGSEAPRTKRLRLAVTEDQGALQNTVLEIPPEKKTVMIRVTRPEREGMPYQVSVAPSTSEAKKLGEASGPVRAASVLRKSVIKATKSTFTGGSAKKTTASAQAQKREAAFTKQQQHAAAMSRSMSSRANLAPAVSRSEGLPASTSVRNKFTGALTAPPTATRTPVAAALTGSGASVVPSEASKGSVTRLGGSIRSSVSQGLGRADAARQARLKEIKARTKAALAGFGSSRTVDAAAPESPRKGATFSPSVTRPTIASLNRAVTTTGGSASLPMLSAITAPLCGLNANVVEGLQRAATMHAGVGALMPSLTPRSSSLRHLRRVMRKQQKQAEVDHERVAAAENISPGKVVPSVIKPTTSELQYAPSIRTVAKVQPSPDKYTTLPLKGRTAARPAGARSALVTSHATTSALNRI
ncbi:uncharacterized protein PAN0_005c2604 [Moesziomyces antarcticus]|uniref:Uncharacterized protein n=2 Tax=Pseudozyma antarctica TaxID=84753 RepID=A0A5C3FLN0_PSEA2|nr:uncharacterized protein PAN0_005c2604 [Moesziomyces antarcticus]GAK64391.1 conserved hypothetical protein [Moesziomyces antarcticus]SPO45106.1 uncharacterized protein PSANT_02792 [Moesziomyces antarcticus]